MAGVRFAPSAFRWNGRVGVALLPSLIVLAGFGGSVPSGIMVVGAMVRRERGLPLACVKHP